MKYLKQIREVKILTVDFNEGKPNWIKISIDNEFPVGSASIFSMEGGKEFQLFNQSGATLKEIDLLKEAYERAQNLNFANVTIEE